MKWRQRTLDEIADLICGMVRGRRSSTAAVATSLVSFATLTLISRTTDQHAQPECRAYSKKF